MRHVDRWRNAVLNSSLPPGARLVAIALSCYMDFDTLNNARPGMARLMRRTGMAERSVQRWLRHLEAAGWVRTVAPGSNAKGRRLTSVYQGTWPRRLRTGYENQSK